MMWRASGCDGERKELRKDWTTARARPAVTVPSLRGDAEVLVLSLIRRLVTSLDRDYGKGNFTSIKNDFIQPLLNKRRFIERSSPTSGFYKLKRKLENPWISARNSKRNTSSLRPHWHPGCCQ
jgi:hypothetical protein